REPFASAPAAGGMSVVRRATRADMPAILELLRELATFEKLTPPDGAAYARLVRDLGQRFDVFVALEDGKAIGYAMFYETYSSFSGKPRLWLEDMYVSPAHRQQGVGKELMREVAREAVKRGCSKATWVVLDWNTEAQKMYDKLGGEKQPWLWYEMSAENLQRMAQPG
ncbi:MAG TPA: GNAT family N-acetyltransferase, partial [Candidatus Thermoplasmatota archaeon]|nr:GNAT family N-acetyltransferase [Candidatus Thermoplasmatota archaeon]